MEETSKHSFKKRPAHTTASGSCSVGLPVPRLPVAQRQHHGESTLAKPQPSQVTDCPCTALHLGIPKEPLLLGLGWCKGLHSGHRFSSQAKLFSPSKIRIPMERYEAVTAHHGSNSDPAPAVTEGTFLERQNWCSQPSPWKGENCCSERNAGGKRDVR